MNGLQDPWLRFLIGAVCVAVALQIILAEVQRFLPWLLAAGAMWLLWRVYRDRW